MAWALALEATIPPTAATTAAAARVLAIRFMSGLASHKTPRRGSDDDIKEMKRKAPIARSDRHDLAESTAETAEGAGGQTSEPGAQPHHQAGAAGPFAVGAHI